MKTDRKLRAAIVCGNKYAFRSVYIPALSELASFATVDVILLDYPEDYPITEQLNELQRDGFIRSFQVIASNDRMLKHQRETVKASRVLRRTGLDALIVDADFPVMHRYLIRSARDSHAKVVGLQKELPTQLLQAFDAANVEQSATPQPKSTRVQKIQTQPIVFAKGAARYAWFLGQRGFANFVSFGLLPLVLTGRGFRLRSFDRYRFVSTRVDAAIVYEERIKSALERFFPALRVVVARHPLTANCRCETTAKTKLLVLLGGPWGHYITAENPTCAIADRWLSAIRRAIELRGFEEVHIRPHPRETGSYPADLSRKLRDIGINAQVVDSSRRSVAAIVCDYAGVVGSFSGALAEAATACRHAFVIGLDGVEKPEDVLGAEAFPGVVRKTRGSRLQSEDFEKVVRESDTHPSVGVAIREILAWA